MEPSKEQFDTGYAAKVRWARSASMEQKFLAGPRLFDQECDALRADIRRRMPRATDDDVEFLLRQYLAYLRRHEE